MIGGTKNQEQSLATSDEIMEDPLNDGCATPEEPETFERIKAPPVCVDVSLRQESMSTEDLQQWLFPEGAIFPSCTVLRQDPYFAVSLETGIANSPYQINPIQPTSTSIPVSVVSVSSNNSCGDSYNLSSDDMSEFKSISRETMVTENASTMMQPPTLNRDMSELLNAKVLLRKTSRQGRSSQRWASAASIGKNVSQIVDASTQSQSPAEGEVTPSHEPVFRLVTGCVPILNSGKILFVSASRKPAWILPKGGWEKDESMEESAVRECFEEAGCIGTLGPALTSVQYEARKAKKRRVENELLFEQAKSISSIPNDTIKIWLEKSKTDSENNADEINGSNVSPNKSDFSMNENSTEFSNVSVPLDETSYTTTGQDHAALTSEAMSRIRQTSHAIRGGGHHTDTESMSVGSTLSTTYSHVQMTLFPLYVQKIEDEWPEKGRFRKAVDIDDAIKMMENRPELQSALIEVKDRKLHIISATVP